MITRQLDPETGIINVVGTGIWTRSAVDQHYDRLTTMVEAARRRRAPVRILSDVSAAEHQTHAVAQRAFERMSLLLGGDDRLAIVVPMANDLLYVSLIADRDFVRAFPSRADAERWLLSPG